MMMKKIRSRRGETLVEVLIALFIAVMAAALLATMIAAAVSINTRVRNAAAAVYGELSAAEGGAEPSPGSVVINGIEVGVDIYTGGGDTFYAYERSVQP